MTSTEHSQSEVTYQFLANSVPQIVWTAKPDGEIDYYNQRWFGYAGVNLEQMRQLGWTAFVHPDDLSHTVDTWQRSLETGTHYEVEFRLKRQSAGAYRWHLVRALPMKDASDKVIQWIGTCTDIDDQRRASQVLEEMVAERTAELRRANRELETFALSVTHDLRAPLRAMMGFCELLCEEYGPILDSRGIKCLDRISSASRRMDELIKAVLAYSQVAGQDLTLEQLDPTALIHELHVAYPNLISSEITISITTPLPRIMANEMALNQCLSNILSNALKFVAPGVKPEVKIGAVSHEQRVILWFKDNGIGIEPENCEKVFELFERIYPARDGSGIGLAIVKRAMERMHGRVWLNSEHGQGTTVWLEFDPAPEAEQENLV